MATEILFDFYTLLVENVFGSILLSIFGVAFAMILILAISRPTITFIFYWFLFYFIVMTTLYLGGIGMVLGFVLSFTYFAVAIIRLFFRQV